MFKLKIEGGDRGAVAGRIRGACETILAPSRALTKTDITHQRKLVEESAHKGHFPHQVYEVSKYFSPTTLKSIHETSQASSRIKTELLRWSKKGGDRVTLFHSTFDKETIITDNVNRDLLELQLQSNFDGISILDDPSLKPEQFEHRLNASIKEIDINENPLEPIPTFRMDQEPKRFQAKLRILADLGIAVANPVFASVKKNWHNYSCLEKESLNNEWWVHMSEIPRVDRNHPRSSMSHLLAFCGITTTALKSKRLHLGLFERLLVQGKRFDAGTLGLLRKEEHKHRYGEDLRCNCFVDKGHTLDTFYKAYGGSDQLKSALYVHEANSSLTEFGNFREAILESRTWDYIREKNHLANIYSSVFGEDPRNQTLI